MGKIDHVRLEAALASLPHRYRGPGGLAGVVKDGHVIAARAWGYADVEAKRPMTTATRLPICSISKQFTCAVLLSEIGDPARLDHRVETFLPNCAGPLPTVRQLCDNQSGLRDYWALTVLHGAMAEQSFGLDQALPLIARTKTTHFTPGTRYSYSNGNFRLVAEMIQAETGRTMEELCAKVVWGPAGMASAGLIMDTQQVANEVTGYEGSDATGFLPADNRVVWFGDAGISACLDDMLAYEAWIDATRDDPDGLYNRLSAAPRFLDGTPARYGLGLIHETVADVHTSGHGGALRGFRAHRLHAASERLSVMVHFNHEGDAHGAAVALMEAALGRPSAAAKPASGSWAGTWLCPETGLLARIQPGEQGATLQFATAPDALREVDGRLQRDALTITRDGSDLLMRRDEDNLTTRLAPVEPFADEDGTEIAGRYTSSELDAAMMIEARDGGVYACFEGMLGTGRMERVHPVARDVWIIATRRSIDAPAPGDWTLSVQRDASGRVSGATLGCWLARGIDYVKAA